MRRRTLESLIDCLLVGSLVTTPLSFFAIYPTTLFPSFALQKVALYSLPALLLLARIRVSGLTIKHLLLQRSAKYFIFVLYGAILALCNSVNPAGVINSYGAVLLLMTYVLAYVGLSKRDATYHVNTIRLFYLSVAVLALVHYVAWGFLRIHWTAFGVGAYSQGTVFIPFTGLSLYYSESPWYPGDVPRFTFFFMEPRVLGSQMVVALFLQMGRVRDMARNGRRHEHRRAVAGLICIFVAMAIIHSTTGYALLLMALPFLFLVRSLGATTRVLTRTVQASYAAYAAIGLVIFSLLLARVNMPTRIAHVIDGGIASVSQLVTNHQDLLGTKAQGMVEGYFKAGLDYPKNLLYFPFGSGWLQHADQARFEAVGINVTGGFGTVGALVVHAGVFGILAFLYATRRVLNAFAGAGQRDQVTERWFLIAVLFTFLGGLLIDTSGFTAGLFLKMFVVELIIIDNYRRRMAQPQTAEGSTHA